MTDQELVERFLARLEQAVPAPARGRAAGPALRPAGLLPLTGRIPVSAAPDARPGRFFAQKAPKGPLRPRIFWRQNRLVFSREIEYNIA